MWLGWEASYVTEEGSEDQVFFAMLKGFGAALLGPEDGAGRSDIGKGFVEEIPEGWRKLVRGNAGIPLMGFIGLFG